jgi:pimeloyl-ACP methyl ester carboxylesterase
MRIKLQTLCLIAAVQLCALSAFAANRPTQHFVKVGDHPISVWSRAPANANYAILLVHGRTWSALPDFDLQVPHGNRSVMQSLAKHGYATYAIDLRGYGATARNADGWNKPDEAAGDVAEVLRWIAQRHPHLRKPVLLGWSMGSLVSHLTAQRYPELLSDLILYGYPRDPAAASNVPPTPTAPPREINTRERAMSDFISPEVTSQTLIDTYVAAALKADPIRADWKQLDDYQALDPARIKNPTLLIRGERDPLAPMPAQARVFTALGNPDKQWINLAGGDHAAMLEDTHDAFIAGVRGFVERPKLRR